MKALLIPALAAPGLLLSVDRAPKAERVQLSILTLHAAALTTPRAAGDSTDTPIFFVTVANRAKSSKTFMRDDAKRTVRLNEQIGLRQLPELSLNPGDSVQVTVSVFENPRAAAMDSLTEASLMDGSNVIGAARVLVTNEGGTTYLRKLDCVAACKVIGAPAEASLDKADNGATVELSGSGGTYHLALKASRVR